ncbi:XAC2610-related protein [Parabacteroides johnsonii]|uniref:XAC2610-related protein n=1 Tax=Parabacteroides johnsonii TaxID=387661 RepID=UPI0016528E52|nr:hypothetical protein [Parabacteroides johnsonii]
MWLKDIYYRHKNTIGYGVGMLLLTFFFYSLTRLACFYYLKTVCDWDNTLLQKSVVINVSKAGTLDSLLSKYRKENLDSLVVTGKINNIDMLAIKHIENLSYIDLQRTKVSGEMIKDLLLDNRKHSKTIKLSNDSLLLKSLSLKELYTYSNAVGVVSENGILLHSVAEKDYLARLSFDLSDFSSFSSLTDTDNVTLQKKQEDYIAQEFKNLNRPRIYIKYKQPVNGYTVRVLWMPYTDESEETSETGSALLYFESESNHFYIQTRSYRDTAVYSHTKLKDGDILFWDYTPKKKDEILSEYSPFFFSDVDFDGEDELLINEHRGGSRGTNSYEVYKIHPYYAEIIKDAPFANLENGNTEFDLKNKTITSSFSDSAFESVTYTYKAIKQEKIEYGDPEPCYKFELVKVEFYYRHTECNEYKVYIKDGYKYKLIKDEIIPINQKDNYPKKRQ